MAEWWELSNDELDSDEKARTEKFLAYYNTFYAPASGRAVLLDIQRLCYRKTGNSEADLARIELFNIIRSNCGVSIASEKAAIDAEAGTIKLGE